MQGNQQHDPKLRSRPSLRSESVSPLRGGGMATPPYPPPPSRSYQRVSSTPIHQYRNSSMTSSNSNTIQTEPCVGGSGSGGMWHQLMVGASSAAVVSAESIKCIKYCLSWVQYAIRQIEQQMSILRAFLVFSLAATTSSSSSCVLTAVKRDVVVTLRKVVDIISRYAGSSLPYHAKMAVRGFILDLPSRWASINDFRSSTASPANSPMSSSTTTTTTTTTSNRINTNNESEETASRLLNLGQESVDMLQSISGVFSGTVQRAEVWLDRLRLRHPPSPITEKNMPR